MPFTATQMDLEMIILNGVNQKEKDKYCMVSLYMQNLKYDTTQVFCETEIDSQRKKTRLWLPKGKEEGCIRNSYI